jgi:hypothetical protein
MTRNENQMYSNISSIAKSLEKIANALETNVPTTPKPKDIPGFEGTLDALDVLCDIKTITDDYASKENLTNMTEARDYYKEKFENTLTPTSDNPDPAGYGNAYETDLQGIRVDSDHDIRSTAKYYQECLALDSYENLNTKKDCILDYVTNEFGALGARYTDIIKFAYYLNGPNKLKYTSASRGYYSCAFNVRLNGHLIQGGKDCLVKGINKEGNERYFALSSVDNFTGFYKRIS